MSRRLRRRSLDAGLPVPKRPYRDSAILYGVLAGLIVVVAYATGGNLLRGVAFAAGFFLLATGWNWWKFRSRLEEERRRR